MDTKDLEKIIRITEGVRTHAVEASKLKNDDARFDGFPEQYRRYYQLVEPIISRYQDYQLEFNAIPNRNELQWSNVFSAFYALRAFLDGVINQETRQSDLFMDKLNEEIFIDDNKPFSAYKIISSITSSSIDSLKIVDNFIDSSTLDFLLEINTKVRIEIITKKLIPNEHAFKVAINKFISQWGGVEFDIKTTNYFHDRYIILDNKNVWHLGPSLNYLGIKPAMITKITDTEIGSHIIDLFNSQWNLANAI